MLIIVGFGNELRGEDAFGVDVIAKLQKLQLPNTKLISTFQLTPELSLELKDAKKIIFIDASYCIDNQYKLACALDNHSSNSLSHQISIKTLMYMIKELYSKNPTYEVFSMLTNSFNEIQNKKNYERCIKETIKSLQIVN
ncbi:hypothetical protein [Halarcobacter sp.]|uniref:hypothetical protein n=1 Tax=Halarcobacter sp. TaxID=2321133 RepID=UPI002AA8D384|nr:hypothetical protein [Halarcobacter sp.]